MMSIGRSTSFASISAASDTQTVGRSRDFARMVNRHRTPSELVVSAATLYHRGIICPAESWHLINDAIVDMDVRALLNALPNDDQELVRSIHCERPLSLESLAEDITDEHYQTLLDWCLESASSPNSPDSQR